MVLRGGIFVASRWAPQRGRDRAARPVGALVRAMFAPPSRVRLLVIFAPASASVS